MMESALLYKIMNPPERYALYNPGGESYKIGKLIRVNGIPTTIHLDTHDFDSIIFAFICSSNFNNSNLGNLRALIGVEIIVVRVIQSAVIVGIFVFFNIGTENTDLVTQTGCS